MGYGMQSLWVHPKWGKYSSRLLDALKEEMGEHIGPREHTDWLQYGLLGPSFNSSVSPFPYLWDGNGNSTSS